ncbi:tetratricopeptide repeat protein [Modestobacter sp. I12A-02628]|uniref:Tetratricopeptide repeat protein n=1 Tax=Goekera deserti TaxID=2497753 RepID=A0A7K3WH47_9ACTN|nr:tetratricopeptide repeat protein [Goekera deserti]MPQ99764.1 tetratricopeptide repeat protein [Goekera deserti]NDI46225.1 tetratricopeptide repeat protein [Goekera deserti]NEL54843.1 tetratricopeptide repeat protein [Goekera deserti]
MSDGTLPEGGVYEWYRRGLDLLAAGNPAAAATLLARVAESEPGRRDVLEALARAQYDAGQHREAMDSFGALAAASPTDHYAHFGLGLAAGRSGELGVAAEHLALAVAMRPDLHHYAQALRGVRARRSATDH